MKEWYVLGRGFGVDFTSSHLVWIHDASRDPGYLQWGKETNGVTPWQIRDGRVDKGALRPPTEIVLDLLDANVYEVLGAEMDRRMRIKR